MRTGLRHSLYDPGTQRSTENSVVSFSPQALPLIHPAYEYALFSPLSLVPYRQAYGLWFIANLFVLAYCGVRICRWLNDPWLSVSLVAGFAPVLATLMHGQDSAWLLLLYVLSVDSRDDFTAGTVLGLTAFRFHLIIPVLVLYTLWKKWRFIEGALLTSGALAALSVWLVGITSSWHYLRTAFSGTEMRQGFPPNAYGIAQALLGPHHAHAAIFVAGACALAALWYASRQEPSLEIAILILPFASYYLMVHDLVIVLIPIALMLRRNFTAILQFVAALLGFSPLSFLIGSPAALMLFWRKHEASDIATRANLSAFMPRPNSQREAD